MLKRISALVLTISMFFVCSVSAGALESEGPVISDFPAVIEDATVSVALLDDDRYEISLSSVEQLVVPTYSIVGEQEYRNSTLTILAESAQERDAILSRIEQVQLGGGTIYDEKDFFGNSCYIYISVTFTTRSSSLGQEARMTSVTTKYSVNSGTTVSSATLSLACIGTSATSGGVYYEHEIPVTSSSYTTTYPASWPYIYDGSPLLGAYFDVTAKRPSGETKTDTVSVTIYRN